MKQLYAQQQQILKKIRSGSSMVEQFHQFYLKYGQQHDFHRFFDYKKIAYYLYQDERKLIEQYYQDRCHQQTDEKRRAYFEQLFAFLKKYNQQVSDYAYSEDEIEIKDRLFYENKSEKEKEQRQKAERQKSMRSDKSQWKFSGIWNYVCQKFARNKLSANEYEKNKNLKLI